MREPRISFLHNVHIVYVVYNFRVHNRARSGLLAPPGHLVDVRDTALEARVLDTTLYYRLQPTHGPREKSSERP